MFNINLYNEISHKIKVLGKKTKIIAVSKNHSKTAIESAISYGVTIFGENRVQEAKAKFDNLKKNNHAYVGKLEAPKGENDKNWKPKDLLLFRSTKFGDDISLTNVCLIGKPSFDEGANIAISPSAPT